MKLYYSPGACSLASHIVLREIGGKFDIEKVDLKSKKTETGADFSAINAKGYVPAIELAPGQNLTEGSAILQYLADLHPASGLAPAGGTVERARVNEWLTFINSEVHKGFSPLFNPDTTEAAQEAAKAHIAKRLTYVESQLADGRAYLTGANFTVADAYLFTIVNWTNFKAISLEAYPKLAAFQARVAARPAVQSALGAEGLLAA